MDMELTDVRIRAAKPQQKPFKLRDGRGLVLLIKPNGSRLWRLRYEFDGVEKGISLGAYPEVSLKMARERRDKARKLIANGIDPSSQRKAEKIATGETVELITREWLASLTRQPYTLNNAKRRRNGPMDAKTVDVLAQLGWQDRTFLDESVDALLHALQDPEDSVVQSAIFALGHRASPRAIDALLPFVTHPSADFRDAAVHGLMPHDTPTVVEAMIKLSRDSDRNVRNWATFTLASQFDSDSPALRAALHERLAESDPEIRGEALVGLARRRDTGIAPAILRELQGDFHGDWAVEAAGLPGDSRLLPALTELGRRLTGENAVYFRGSLQSAIAACEGRRGESSSILQ
jgi:hypothetical protein